MNFFGFVHGRHAHLDDPGRADWEGFPSGTKAAAAGMATFLICTCVPKVLLLVMNF